MIFQNEHEIVVTTFVIISIFTEVLKLNDNTLAKVWDLRKFNS